MSTDSALAATRRPPTAKRILLRATVVAIAYILATLASYQFAGGFEQEADVWLASGVAIGVLTLADIARWPAYSIALAFGAFAANVITGESWTVGLLYALDELVVAWAIAW